jgi:hypothetical protein
MGLRKIATKFYRYQVFLMGRPDKGNVFDVELKGGTTLWAQEAC